MHAHDADADDRRWQDERQRREGVEHNAERGLLPCESSARARAPRAAIDGGGERARPQAVPRRFARSSARPPGETGPRPPPRERRAPEERQCGGRARPRDASDKGEPWAADRNRGLVRGRGDCRARRRRAVPRSVVRGQKRASVDEDEREHEDRRLAGREVHAAEAREDHGRVDVDAEEHRHAELGEARARRRRWRRERWHGRRRKARGRGPPRAAGFRRGERPPRGTASTPRTPSGGEGRDDRA
jgi:hypothetical protein